MWVRTVGIALAASALTLLLTSGLVGAQSGGSNQIHACAGDRGALRLVTTEESCVAGENRVVWNAQGVEGAQGVLGPQGPPGAKGAAGKKGLRGKPGKPGKAKLQFGGDLATQVLLKKLDKKLTALDTARSPTPSTVLPHARGRWVRGEVPESAKMPDGVAVS